MKKFIFFLFLFLIGWFWLLHITHAASLSENTSGNSLRTLKYVVGANKNISQVFIPTQSGIPTTFTLTHVTNTGNLTFSLLEVDPSVNSPTSTFSGALYSAVTSTVLADQTLVLPINGSTSLSTSKKYAWFLSAATQLTSMQAIATSSAVVGGSAFYQCQAAEDGCPGTGYYDFFITSPDSQPNGLFAYPYSLVGGTSTISITLAWPLNGASQPDFQNWVIGWQGIQATLYPKLMGVEYGLQGSTTTFTDYGVFTPSLALNPFATPKNHPLTSLLNLTATSSWTARPVYVDGSSTLYGASIVFVIDPSVSVSFSEEEQLGAPYLRQNALDNTTSTFNNACQVSTFFGIPYLNNLGACLSNTAVYVLKVIFIPDSAVIDPIKNDLVSFQQVFPFSVVFSAVSSTQAALAQSTTSLTFSLPLFSSSGKQFEILSSSTVSRQFGQGTKDTLFTYERAVIWISGVLTVVFTVL